MANANVNREGSNWIAREAVSLEKAVPGDLMQDGSYFMGVSPTTQRPMFLSLQNSGMVIGDFAQAAANMKAVNAHGHQDWNLPDAAENLAIVQVIQRKPQLKKAFNMTDAGPMRYAMSSTPAPEMVRTKKAALASNPHGVMGTADEYAPGAPRTDQIIAHQINNGAATHHYKYEKFLTAFCVRS